MKHCTSAGLFAIIASLGVMAGPALAAPPVPGVAPATVPDGAVVPGVTPVYPGSPSGSEVRLPPEEVRKILDAAAKGAKPIPVATGRIVEEAPCATAPHGEMGMEAGTGGYGAMYGAAVVPFGCHGSVAIAIGTGTGGRDFRRRR